MTCRIPPMAQKDHPLRVSQCWLQSEKKTANAIVEWLVMDRFLRAFPSKDWKAVGLKEPSSPRYMIEALESALATLEIGRTERRKASPNAHWSPPYCCL